MKVKIILACILLFPLWSRILYADGIKDVAKKQQAEEWLSKKNESGFLENRGQMMDIQGNPVPFVLFKAEAPNLNLWITNKGVTLQTLKIEEEEEKDFSPYEKQIKKQKKHVPRMEHEKTTVYWERVEIELRHASIRKENIIKEGASITDFNYFYPHCPDGIYGVKEYERITIREVYPGIDWVWRKDSQKGYKHEFVVKPGSDYRQIEMVYLSKKPIKVNAQGELQIYTAYGNLKEAQPVSFYQGNKINTAFNLKNQKRVSIQGDSGYESVINFEVMGLGSITDVLVIDPQLVWGTFYGATGFTGPMCLDIDNSGNIFIGGYTTCHGSVFPLLNAGTFFQGTIYSFIDAFISKFSNTGVLLWSTFYGGNDNEACLSVVTDINGNVFITGSTLSSNFPVQNAGTFYQGTYGGGVDWEEGDAFILKFNNLGTRLWATYYGGLDKDVGYSITVDNSGNVFVTGKTLSTNLTVYNSGTFFQASNAGSRDAFILKFDNVGNLLWATYYGGSSDDMGYSIAVDNSGNVFIVGNTYSTDFPVHTVTGAYNQTTNAGQYDAFILKFDNLGNRLWATYYGGSLNEDGGSSVVVDNNGNIFIIGYTNSYDLPLQSAGTFFQSTYGGGHRDAFILKFNNTGTRLWATYYGGNGSEIYFDISYPSYFAHSNLALDNCGNLYVGIDVNSNPFPHLTNSCDANYYDNSYNGGSSDNLISLFSNDGTLLWCTYAAGSGYDFRCRVSVDNSNNLIVTGEWIGTGHPLANPGGGAYYNPTFNGWWDDGFMMKFLAHPCICSALPTQLVSFHAQWHNTQQTQALLTWQINPDANTVQFVIERSTDHTWQEIAVLSNTGTSYEYRDVIPYERYLKMLFTTV